MITHSPLIYLIDDDPSSLTAMSIMCDEMNWESQCFTDPSIALSTMAKRPSKVSVVVCDFLMPQLNGLQLIEQILELNNQIPIILVTAHATIETAIEAMKLGAFDFVTKPVNFSELAIITSRALKQRQFQLEYERMREQVSAQSPQEGLIGKCRPMEEIFRIINKVASTKANILITGETGTGKSLIARAIHNQSNRRDHPFVSINCASIPETLLESELFGHEKGSFTGAVSRRDGLFLSAEGGTIFMDEIGDMPLGLQSKILTVIQERKFRPIGSSKEVEVDVRIISATHKNLQLLIKESKFREDLYFRLNVVNLPLPALRERREDIPILCDYFLKKFNRHHKSSVKNFSPQAMLKLCAYHWPGNIR